MAKNFFYVATPYDDLEAPHWRLVESEDGGEKAIVFALRLRGLAAISNRGGLVCMHNGVPMNLMQIGIYLGYTFPHLRRCLEILQMHSLAELAEGEGVSGIVVTDPVLRAHLDRVAISNKLLLPSAPPKKPGRRPTGNAMTPAERKRQQRARSKIICHDNNPVTSDDNIVTQPNQLADNMAHFSCHDNFTIEVNGSNKTTSSDDIVTRFCSQFEVHDRPLLRHAVARALAAGHTLKSVQAAIDDAKKRSTRNSVNRRAIMTHL